MEKFQEALLKANQKLKIADHMVFMTYPLVKDNKLLLAIIDNIFLSLSSAMSAVLYYERTFKRIPPYNEENFESKFIAFKERCAKRLGFDDKHISLISNIRAIIMDHKKSPVEFSRNDKFVICSSTYRMRTITIDQIKRHVAETRSFIKKAEEIVNKNDRIFRSQGIFGESNRRA